MKSVLCVFVMMAASIVTANALSWVACKGATKGVIKSVVVKGCESTPVCVLTKGQNASFEIDFTMNEDSKTATSVVHGIIAGIPVPFPLDNPDVCKDSHITCPFKSGTEYDYQTSIYVKKEFPSISCKVRWEIKDENGNDIVCIELPTKITASKVAAPPAAVVRSDNSLRFASRLRL